VREKGVAAGVARWSKVVLACGSKIDEAATKGTTSSSRNRSVRRRRKMRLLLSFFNL